MLNKAYNWGDEIMYKCVVPFYVRVHIVAMDLYISPQGAKSQCFRWKIHVVLFVVIYNKSYCTFVVYYFEVWV